MRHEMCRFGTLHTGTTGRPVARIRGLSGALAVTIVFVIVVACLLVAAPARAQTSWNFQVDDGNWSTSGERLKQPASANYLWQWNNGSTTLSPAKPRWHVESEGVTRSTASAYYLESPLLTLTGTVNSARISIAHNYLFRTGTDGKPLYAGQFQYQLNESGTWVGLPLNAFSTGSVSSFLPAFGFSPFWTGTSVQIVDRSTFVVPNYLTPTGSGTLPFVTPGAATFTGSSPGWSAAYVPSQVILTASTGLPAGGIQSLQMRFTNLNYGAGCLPQDGWNVKFVQVDFSDVINPVPEPTALALIGVGLATLAARAAARRRRHQRASRPSDNP